MVIYDFVSLKLILNFQFLDLFCVTSDLENSRNSQLRLIRKVNRQLVVFKIKIVYFSSEAREVALLPITPPSSVLPGYFLTKTSELCYDCDRFKFQNIFKRHLRL